MITRILCIALVVCFVQSVSAGFNPVDIPKLKKESRKGNIRAKAELGCCYYFGEDTEVNYRKALKYFHAAAAGDEPLALFHLGYMNFLGQDPGDEYRDSDSLFTRAVQGFSDRIKENNPRDLLSLAVMHMYGLGMERNPDRAAELVDKAAAQGYVRARYIKAMFIHYGAGYPQDHSRAFEILSTLEKQNFAPAGYQIGNMYFNGQGVTQDHAKAIEYTSRHQSSNQIYQDMKRDGDTIIEDHLPPKFPLQIEEGSCGECCAWSLLNAETGQGITQIEINDAGGAPGRGLHSNELEPALKKLGIRFKNLEERFQDASSEAAQKKYRDFLNRSIIGSIKKGHPVLMGVKRYPTQFPQWPFDHFLLVVGYNKDLNQLIFNDMNFRRRLDADTLVNQRDQGYSFVNDFNFVWALEILDNGK